MTNEWKIVERKSRRRNVNQSLHAKISIKRNLKSSFQAHIPHEMPQLSKEKKDALLDRIKKLRQEMQKTCLITDTISEIVQFHGKNDPQTRLKLVCYGLGSFSTSTNALYQLAYALAVEESIREKIDTKLDQVEVFDPVMNETDKEIAENFKVHVITKNESGKRVVDCKTIFFMPHCGKMLYQNVIQSNWEHSAHTLEDMMIIGNSFHAYSDRTIASAERIKSILVQMAPYTSEKEVKWQIKKHPEYVHYEAAFNDLSIHLFPHEKMVKAQKDTNLLAAIEQFTKDQETIEAQDEELIQEK